MYLSYSCAYILHNPNNRGYTNFSLNNPDCCKLLLQVQVGTIVFLCESSSYRWDWGKMTNFSHYFINKKAILSKKNLIENDKRFKRKNYLREELRKCDHERHKRALYEQEDRVLSLLVSSTDAVRTIRPILCFVSVIHGRYTNKTIWVSILYLCSREYVHIKERWLEIMRNDQTQMITGGPDKNDQSKSKTKKQKQAKLKLQQQ